MNKQKWIARAREMGIEGLEIYEGQSAERRVAWFDGQMDSFGTSSVLGTSIRAIVDGKAANLALEAVDDERIDETLAMLIEQAKLVSSEDTEELRAPETTGARFFLHFSAPYTFLSVFNTISLLFDLIFVQYYNKNSNDSFNRRRGSTLYFRAAFQKRRYTDAVSDHTGP